MKRQVLILISVCFFTTCGLYEYYFLPQVPEGNRTYYDDTTVLIELPDINTSEYYYATGYNIFYRIYLSNTDIVGSIITPEQRSSISSNLTSNFNFFSSYTNPTNNTLITSPTTFSGRGYYRLELEDGTGVSTVLTSDGGLLSIEFTSDSSFLTINDIEHSFYRYTFVPGQSRDFTPLSELSVDNELNDFARLSPFAHAYVSMYLIAEGENNENFTTVYSKPIHLNIFRLQ